MEPISGIVLWILHHYGVVTVAIYAVALTTAALSQWFKARGSIAASDADVIGATIASRIANRNYVEMPDVFRGKPNNTRIVQAIYNKRTNAVIDARLIASRVAPAREIIDKHAAGDGVVIYT